MDLVKGKYHSDQKSVHNNPKNLTVVSLMPESSRMRSERNDGEKNRKQRFLLVVLNEEELPP